MKVFVLNNLAAVFTTVMLSALATAVTAAPGHGGAHLFRQPNGSEVRVVVWGDEFYQDVESPDGFTLVRGRDGWICYAMLSADGSEYISTGVRYVDNSRAPNLLKGLRINRESVREKVRRGREVLGHDRLIEERQRQSQRQGQQGRQGRQGQGFLSDGINPASAASEVKTIVGLTLMVQFRDEKFHPNITKTMAEEFCNREGGVNGNTPAGSVRDYFLDVSNGLLDYSSVVAPVITLDKDKSYYDSETGGVTGLISDALTKLNEMDFSLSGVTAKNNTAAALNILYAGNPGWGWGNGLWPHAGRYWDWDMVRVGGISFSEYQITNWGSADAAPGIGTFVHENGHLLMGWPDLYSYTGHSNGVGSWCVMAAQDNNNPQQPNAFFRDLAGWITRTDITAYAIGNTLSHTANSPAAYVYERRGSAEVYYIEARRNAGPRNSALPGSGLAIWHVHADGTNLHKDKGFPLVALMQADGRMDLENLSNNGDTTDLFRFGLNTEFSGTTNPASIYHDGTASGLSFSEISDSGAVMTFKVDIGGINGFYGRIGAYARAEEDVVVEVDEDLTLDMLVNIPAPAVAGKTLTIRRSRTASVPAVSLKRERGLMGNLFIVPVGAVLILEDVTISGNTRLPGFPSQQLPCGGALVIVDKGGKLVMNDGAVLHDNNANTSDGAGGGVHVSGEFTMNGGKISGNTASRTGGAGGNPIGTGDGGGVYVSGGVFTMNGGEISGNTGFNGGGVCVNGKFTMNGGGIIGNIANRSGGGVHVSNGSEFIMTGGGICENAAERWGGGVFITGSESTAAGKFTMTGGEISVNTSWQGSNIGIAGNAVVRLDGGTVTGAAAMGTVSVVLDQYEFNAPSRQWYSNTIPSNSGGAMISGATGISYNVPASAAGTFYYYVSYREAAGGTTFTSAVTTITIGEAVSVQTTNRVIPNGPTAETAILPPVNVLTAEFSAGPNPVAKSAGTVNFYRRGRRVDNTTLTIYDASGNVIRKIPIRDDAGALRATPLHTTPLRQVGSWDLKDAKDRAVGAGTYLVRGTITMSDGKRERVAMIIGVR